MSNALLTFSRGQALTAESLRALVALAREVLQSQIQPTPGIRLLQLPDGILPSIERRSSGGGRVAHPFKMSVDPGEGDDVLLRFAPGIVDGIEPTIGDTALSKADQDGLPPALHVPAAAFALHGTQLRALVWIRYELDHNTWQVARAVPVVASKLPDRKPWEWHKLVGMLFREAEGDPVTARQMVFFNQGFTAIDRRPSGQFTPIAWAET
jgi:hypothetical protein